MNSGIMAAIPRVSQGTSTRVTNGRCASPVMTSAKDARVFELTPEKYTKNRKIASPARTMIVNHAA